MKKYLFSALTALIVFACDQKPATKFQKLSADDTGIDFNNINVENEAINIFTYEYLYNGGGVAAGDINNDGLVDLYFSSNNLENKLYLNEGGMKFKDITESSKAGCKPGWKTGVSMVDINADGWLDIYVCRSADSRAANRENSLLINNHDLTFTDKAKEYGLNDNSYSTQAAFFDFDRDGDLDAFILNHSLLSISNSFNISNVNRRVGYPFVGNKFYENENGKFKDITSEVGVIGGASNYGLGIGVSDVNNDGWPDVYVSNDYVDNDRLYLNRNGVDFFDATDSLFTQVSQFSMGLDIADVNNDGFTDIISLDMLPEDNKRQKLLFGPDKYDVYSTSVKNGFYYQNMRNMLQLNNGDGSFSEVGQLAGISNTDWSWSALLADFDNDGLQDLFISNGYKRDFTNNDFLKYRADQEIKTMTRDGKRNYGEMLKKIPSNKVHNYIFRNEDDLHFKDMKEQWGLEEKILTNGATYADLDNDGDLDIVTNNIDELAGIYENKARPAKNNFLKVKLVGTGQNATAIGSKVLCYANGKTQCREMFLTRGFQSSIDPVLIFGLGESSKVDSLIVKWPNQNISKASGIAANQTYVVDQKTTEQANNTEEKKVQPLFSLSKSKIDFKHLENDFVDFKTQTLLPRMYSTLGPAMTGADVNRDGLVDLFIGGAKGQPSSLFVQDKGGNYLQVKETNFNESASSEIVDAIFFDKDNDGDLDLYLVSGSYEFSPEDKSLQDYVYENDGKGKFKLVPSALPQILLSGSCVRAADYDSDGDMDLFVGSRLVPGSYPITPESILLINDGKGIFSKADKGIIGPVAKAGMITDATWIDLNQDKKLDLVVVGEWMPVSFFVNANGKFVDQTKQYADQMTGWWNCIQQADLDKDGDVDFVVGNFGMNNQMKPTASQPVSIFYLDIDNNGSIDPIVTYFIEGKEYPYPNRDEITEQVPMLKKRFNDYESYSNATLSTILTTDELAKSGKLTATTFETVIMINDQGKFRKFVLPPQSQYAPVFSISVSDFNGDSNPDILLSGNLEKTRVRTGLYAGNYGSVLLGDGKGNFVYLNQRESGFSVRGDVRKTVIDNSRVIFAINNSRPILYDQTLIK